MTQDELWEYCVAAHRAAEAAELAPDQLLSLAGYLATAAINHVHPKHRREAERLFIKRLRIALSATNAVADLVHSDHADADYRH